MVKQSKGSSVLWVPGEVEAMWRDGEAGLWIGCDEAGRGPLAGPVTGAAVIFGSDFEGIAGLTDSKLLSSKRREALFPLIQSQCLAYSIVDVGSDIIDSINILEASLQAMSTAVHNVLESVRNRDLIIRGVFVDGKQRLPISGLAQYCYVKGDRRSFHIAAASILAKVHRDGLMRDFSIQYPGYGFERHAGYGTKAHREAIQRLGRCSIHRKTFKVSGVD